MYASAMRASSSRWGRIGRGPNAQFMPTLSSGKCAIEFHIASTDWLDTNVTPASLKVVDTITGTRRPASAKYC